MNKIFVFGFMFLIMLVSAFGVTTDGLVSFWACNSTYADEHGQNNFTTMGDTTFFNHSRGAVCFFDGNEYHHRSQYS